MAVTVKQIGRCGETRLKELSVTEIGERGDREFLGGKGFTYRL